MKAIIYREVDVSVVCIASNRIDSKQLFRNSKVV